MNEITRRQLLARGGWMAVGMMTPPWLAAVTKSDLMRRSTGGKIDPDNVLVVCQWTGGNDGLNTLIPYADAEYKKLRPTLGIGEESVIKIDETIGLHPDMAPIKELYDEGKVAFVQGVGYPNPNRSHFKSMDIWQTASPTGSMSDGWVGRHLDVMSGGQELSAVAGLGLSGETIRALKHDRVSIPCFASLSDIRNMIGDPDVERMLREVQGDAAAEGSAVWKVQKANNSAFDAMAALHAQLDTFDPQGDYGDHAFGRGFRQIAQLVATSPSTRVFYFSAGGFDTHARQADQHATLVREFSRAARAFQREMEMLGKDKKVTLLVFSEFGRRAYENASEGTDHGKAAPMILIGSQVEGGLHGPRPDLTNLDDGDVGYDIDFRSVYATVLDKWLGGDSETVLGDRFEHVTAL